MYYVWGEDQRIKRWIEFLISVKSRGVAPLTARSISCAWRAWLEKKKVVAVDRPEEQDRSDGGDRWVNRPEHVLCVCTTSGRRSVDRHIWAGRSFGRRQVGLG